MVLRNFSSSLLFSIKAEVESAVTASRKARCEPGTGAKMFRPLVWRAGPQEPSLFWTFLRNSHPRSMELLISFSDGGGGGVERFPSSAWRKVSPGMRRRRTPGNISFSRGRCCPSFKILVFRKVLLHPNAFPRESQSGRLFFFQLPPFSFSFCHFWKEGRQIWSRGQRSH